MASSQSYKEWLTKNIEDENIRFYSFDDFIDQLWIGSGGYGTVFKAKVKSLGRTVVYKLLHSQNEDEMIENFVKEVGNNIMTSPYLDILLYLNHPNDTFSSRFIATLMIIPI